METVYLIGPITGKQVDFEWREKAAMAMESHGIEVASPLRGKINSEISNEGLGLNGGLPKVEWAQRDYEDISEASIVLAYFPYIPNRQSIGSFMELGIAHEQGKIIVLAAHDETILEHLFIRAFSTARFSDLDRAVIYIIENYADTSE